MDDVVRGELAGKGKKKQRACGRVPVRIYDGGGLTQRWPRPRGRVWYRASTPGTLATCYVRYGGGRYGMGKGRLQKGGSSGHATGPRVDGERRHGRSPGGGAEGAGSENAMGAEWRADGLESRCFGKWSTRGLPVSSERIGHSVRLGMCVIRRRSGRLVPQRMRSLGASRGGLTIQSRPCAGSRRRAI